jgi:ADP-L-glycero-D-manno-heptose 6-epimerase
MDKREFLRLVMAGKSFGRIDGILHQGACSDTTKANGRYMMWNNFTYSKELLHYALARGVPFVYASSASVYGDSTVFKEDPANERPLNVYGYSKALFDQYVRRFLPNSESTLVGLRYFNVYGPGEWHKGHMASMVYQSYVQLKQSGVVRLFGSSHGCAAGEQRRDFIFVDDVVRVNLFFVTGRRRVGIFNVGTGYARSFNEVARAVINSLGYGSIEYVPFPQRLRSRYQAYTQADLTSLREAGYEGEFAPLEEGVARAVAAWEAELIGGLPEGVWGELRGTRAAPRDGGA